ncbi:hypothetical protein K474DRAFT_1659781 [Panus rudis PR-1116 ss-1]|nr:hypothetical protein K474DRAFT_1659781 [Panus rudis PR-1116 ss-1]
MWRIFSILSGSSQNDSPPAVPKMTLSVGHYGHPLLNGTRHWSFLLHTPDGDTIAYQVAGTVDSYHLREPVKVEPGRARTFMGRVNVGTVDGHRQSTFDQILKSVPVRRGDSQWNCQNWVVESLKALGDHGFNVEVLSQQELLDKLSHTARSSSLH